MQQEVKDFADWVATKPADADYNGRTARDTDDGCAMTQYIRSRYGPICDDPGYEAWMSLSAAIGNADVEYPHTFGALHVRLQEIV